MRKRTVILGVAVALALVAGLVAFGVRWYDEANRSELERAMDLAPAAERYSFTHWTGVRRELAEDASGGAASSGPDALAELLAAGFDRDLTSASALLESAELLEDRFGWSPLDASWELFAQSTAGAVVTVAVPDDTSFADLADRLEELGYTRPSDDDGVWTGGEDLVAQISAEAGMVGSPVLQHVALDEDTGVLRTSDAASYLEDVVAGDAGGPRDLDDVVDASGEALSAAVYTGEHACSALAMSQAGPGDQAAADDLLAEAGEVSPLRAFAMAVQPDGEVVVAMSFESEEQARTNADSRAALASGPAPGQGGDFADRFELGEVTAEGPLLTMRLEPVAGAYVLSDLSTGPLLLATC